MKPIIAILTFTGFVLAACAGSQKSGTNDATTVENGIEYHVETDRSTYSLGESVRILYRITNTSNEIKDLGMVPKCEYCVGQFSITSGGREVWRSCRVIPPCGMQALRLNPHESWEYADMVWEMTNDNGTLEPEDDFPVLPDVYTLTGRIWPFDEDSRVPVSLSIKIR